MSLNQAAKNSRAHLLETCGTDGHWTGHLSGSALATAIAAFALYQIDPQQHSSRIGKAIDWLITNRSIDGGWGDTPDSPPNLSTTLLASAALRTASGDHPDITTALTEADEFIQYKCRGADPAAVYETVLDFYGNDRTFSSPILTTCALSGMLGKHEEAWNFVPQLPFEIATLPHAFFKWIQMPVVSYALPALIAIGLAGHYHKTGARRITRLFRNKIAPRVLRILNSIQPSNGGFLEAIPLTAFVCMSLASCGLRRNTVVTRGEHFLVESMRADGSWPIDSNLATWLTTLSIKSLGDHDRRLSSIGAGHKQQILDWLLSQQFKSKHPYTGARPGGWAWTNLPGGVPDADDTAGALIALKLLEHPDADTLRAACDGINWLLGLQNRDGGIPTFCKGLGKLDFDKSCPDITAHCVRAFLIWHEHTPPRLQKNISSAIRRAIVYLATNQNSDGSWHPLWFGNQWRRNHVNPVYGTAQVVSALTRLPQYLIDSYGLQNTLERAKSFLLEDRNPDGTWGASDSSSGSIEETSIALAALAEFTEVDQSIIRCGLNRLLEATDCGRVFRPSPIGLYFASLWYHEELYPVIFAHSAFSRWNARGLKL